MTLSILLQVSMFSVEWLKLLLATLPVLSLIILLGVLKMSGDKSALITLAISIIISLTLFGLPPESMALALVYGTLKAIFPILIIIIMAIFSYNVLVHTEKMEILKEQFSSISSDKSIQVLLLTWGFGGLLEGMAGFGTAVAIPAAILISLGFKPIFAALTSLIANSVATAFGAVGTPVKVLAEQANIADVQMLSIHVVFQLGILMYIIPFVLMFMTDPRIKALPKNVFVSLIVGTVSLLTQYLSARYIGAETPAVLGSLASIAAIIIYARLKATKEDNEIRAKFPKRSLSDIFKAWSVYGLILLLIVITSPLLPLKSMFEPIISFALHFDIFDMVKEGMRENIPVKISLIDAGFLLFFGSLIGGLIQGAKIGDLFKLLWKVCISQRRTIITVCCLISLSAVMDFSGMIFTIGQALAFATGALYPLFAPMIGCLGTFLTGSDTSSNILFGKLQATIAENPAINSDPSWLSAANTTGATGGKIISPQSIAVATSACNQQGREGEIMKKAILYALGYIIIAGLIVYFAPKIFGSILF